MTELTEKRKTKYASISVVKSSPDIAVIEALTTYIPFEQFKETFNFIGELVEQHKIKKLVFDKRKLTVFHQASMEWYFTEWKEQMYDLGLRTHRKILPNDDVFKHSVKIGREKINASHPNAKFHSMDISYTETIEEAVKG